MGGAEIEMGAVEDGIGVSEMALCFFYSGLIHGSVFF